jgi:cytochrome P450
MVRSILEIRRDPLSFLNRMSAQFGDVVQFPIPDPPTYLVSHPETARRVLVSNARAYGKRTIQYTTLSLVTGEGLLTADTESWRGQRRRLQPAFHHSTLEFIADHVRTSSDRMVARWSQNNGAVVDVDEAMMHLALEVVGKSLFGADLSGDAARLADATVEALDIVVKKARSPLAPPLRVPTPANVSLRKAIADLDAAVDAMLAERATWPLLAGQAPRDMLDLLLMADDAGQTMPRDEIRNQVITFIVAGHETVASALTWAWQLLVAHPQALRRLRAEVAPVAAAGGPQFADLAALPYTAAVVDEVLRLYPPAWLITRRSHEDDVLDGVDVKAGSLVIVSPWLVHRHASMWDRPNQFIPERFLDQDGQRRRDVVNGPGYIPFGAGPRLCIGRDMALVEAILVLAAIAPRVELESVGPTPIAMPLVTIRPRGGLPMRVTVRPAP